MIPKIIVEIYALCRSNKFYVRGRHGVHHYCPTFFGEGGLHIRIKREWVCEKKYLCRVKFLSMLFDGVDVFYINVFLENGLEVDTFVCAAVRGIPKILYSYCICFNY